MKKINTIGNRCQYCGYIATQNDSNQIVIAHMPDYLGNAKFELCTRCAEEIRPWNIERIVEEINDKTYL